jgi:hypothetical protein
LKLLPRCPDFVEQVREARMLLGDGEPPGVEKREMSFLFPSETVSEILVSPSMAKFRWMLFALFIAAEELRLEFPF